MRRGGAAPNAQQAGDAPMTATGAPVAGLPGNGFAPYQPLSAHAPPQPPAPRNAMQHHHHSQHHHYHHALAQPPLGQPMVAPGAPPLPAPHPQHMVVERGCQKKTRLVWTAELHTRFLFAVEQIGLRTAVPRTILQARALLHAQGHTDMSETQYVTSASCSELRRCTVLCCVALRCVALRCVALRCVALRCVARHCTHQAADRTPFVPAGHECGGLDAREHRVASAKVPALAGEEGRPACWRRHPQRRLAAARSSAARPFGAGAQAGCTVCHSTLGVRLSEACGLRIRCCRPIASYASAFIRMLHQ